MAPDRLQQEERTQYLPAYCPLCGRRRVLFDGGRVWCEKCGWDFSGQLHSEALLESCDQRTKRLVFVAKAALANDFDDLPRRVRAALDALRPGDLDG